jgi:hypothetical protein
MSPSPVAFYALASTTSMLALSSWTPAFLLVDDSGFPRACLVTVQ